MTGDRVWAAAWWAALAVSAIFGMVAIVRLDWVQIVICGAGFGLSFWALGKSPWARKRL